MMQLSDFPTDEWIFLRRTQRELISEEEQAKVGDRAALQNKIDDIEIVLRGSYELSQIRKAYVAAGMSERRIDRQIESLKNTMGMSQSGEPVLEDELSDAQIQYKEKIEVIRELMQREIDSCAWPRDRRGKEGLLRFVWRKHTIAIKKEWGVVEYETIRRKCSPCECRKLGILPIPK